MANTLKLKQSADPTKVPATAQLQLGELAVNTYDGRLFTKKKVGATESIVEFVSNNAGTWGISITGNAATATVPTFSGDSVYREDITARTETGFYQTNSGTAAEGWPNNRSWQHLIACTHDNNGNYYSMQLAGDFFAQDWYLRNTDNLGTRPWSRILHSNNYSSYALPLTGGTLSGGLTISSGGAAITGGLTAYSATNDYTSATVKFGRNATAYLALHGGSSGNYLTHVVTDADPDPFQIDIQTETKAWRHQFAVSDGFMIPGQGIRWGASVGTAPPAFATRSAGTRVVLYPSLGASAVDYALGYDTNTFWSSIATTAKAFKQYAGTTPIAALHGDGNPFFYHEAPATQDTTVTLTAAQIRANILTSTPTAAITLTLPTSSNMNNTLWDGATGLDWSVINLATDGTKTVTLAGNTNHTIVGNTVIAINSSARFRTVKSIYEQNGLPVFTTYRIS